jgi:hypothetical protein
VKTSIKFDGVLLQYNYIILRKKTLIFERKQRTFAHSAYGIAVVCYNDLGPPTFFPKPKVIGKHAARCKLNSLDANELSWHMKFTKIKRQNLTEIKLLGLI